MQIDIPPTMAPLMATALTAGVETSLLELADLLGLPIEDPLQSALAVVQTVKAWGLELNPSHNRGNFSSARVLRVPELDSSSAAIAKLMAAGEGALVEYKSSLLCSIRDWDQSGSLIERAGLPGEVLKTVCAFLNTDGGNLLIGIRDDGNQSQGLERDLQLKNWDMDKWQLHLVSLIEGRFLDGATVMPYVRLSLHALPEGTVAQVAVMARTAPSFVKRESNLAYEFFVRRGSRTDSLQLPAFYAHLEARSAI